MIHVLPIRDTRPHSRTTDCPCGPALDFDAPELQVVHNAFDHRENREKTGAPAGGWVCSADCAECDGSGKDNLMQPCFQCDGTGENPLFDPCPKCHERGLHVDPKTAVTECLMCRDFAEPTRFEARGTPEPEDTTPENRASGVPWFAFFLVYLSGVIAGMILSCLLPGAK